MPSAPFEVIVTGSDDETFTFVIPFENTDGTAFPFSDYEIEYSLRGHDCGGCWTLDQTSGITIADPNVTFTILDKVCRGNYQHGCRITNIASGVVSQVFDGSVTITEGNFR